MSADTASSHAAPTQAGMQTRGRSSLRLALRLWMPAFAAMALGWTAPIAAKSADATHIVAAQARPTASPALTMRVRQLPDALAGKIAYADYFTPGFAAAVPEAQFRALTAQLIAAHGPVTGVEAITPRSANSAELKLGFVRGIASVEIAIDGASPNKIVGLRITGVETRGGDGVATLTADFTALPGAHGVLLRELGNDAAPLLAIRPDAAGAQGSTFKLWLLAETARGVAAGERHWEDLIPLAPDVPSSPITGRWPSTPMTLQAAVTAMIAVSDNRSTDSVLAALDRPAVQSIAARLGADPRGMPLLGTREAFAIKMDPALRAGWCPADQSARATLLSREGARIRAFDFAKAVQPAGTMAIDCIEWFASPAAMVRTMDWLRNEGGPVAHAILAVNPGVAPALAQRFGYVGYKGGSEPGVIAMTYLVRTKAGRWYAASGWWNDPAGAVEDMRFAALMSRVLGLIPTD